MSVAAEALDLACPAQLCCSVLDSIGGAESYSVSVSWVGSPANVQGFDSVPAPQSQKNLQVQKKKKHKTTTYDIFLFFISSGISDVPIHSQKNSFVIFQWDPPVMPNELHIVSLMTLLDTVHTDGVAVCRITGVTPAEEGGETHVWLVFFFCSTNVTDCPAANSQLWCKCNFKDYL